MKARRPRKPATLLRYLRNGIDVTQKWYSLAGDFPVEVNGNLNRCRALLRELRASLKGGG